MEPKGAGGDSHEMAPAGGQTQPSGHATHVSPGAGEQLFTCPMHPEVVEKKPGNCPKCGMQLVKKKEKPK